jgi:hypothetical protein
MKEGRTLSFSMSQYISNEELKEVAAGQKGITTFEGSYHPQDGSFDPRFDPH